MAVARHRLGESRGETSGRVLRRDTARAASCLREVIRGNRREDAADDDVAVGLDLRENLGRRQGSNDVGEVGHIEGVPVSGSSSTFCVLVRSTDRYAWIESTWTGSLIRTRNNSRSFSRASSG